MRRPLALTVGEPAGICGEIALQAWLRRADGVPPFVMLDDPVRLGTIAEALGWRVPIRVVDSPKAAMAIFERALPVLPVPAPVVSRPGCPDAGTAPMVLASIDMATDLAMAGRVGPW